MSTLTSADGTTIAFEHTGAGPALILVDGAMCYRGAGPATALAAALADRFTVYTYDRRGRGESSDTPPYSVAREVEDLRALVAHGGGQACLCSISSGAAIALATAAADPGVIKAALYDPPYLGEVEDGTRIQRYTEQLTKLLAEGPRGDAVALFLTNVGTPEPAVAGMRTGPGWAAMEAIAPTLAYDDEAMNGGRVPREFAQRISAPVLVLAGGAGLPAMRQAAKLTAQVLTTAEFRVLDGQTHAADPVAIAPVLTEFFTQS